MAEGLAAWRVQRADIGLACVGVLVGVGMVLGAADVSADDVPVAVAGMTESHLPSELASRVDAATVRIESTGCRGRHVGTGVVVGGGVVLTAGHVTDMARTVKVEGRPSMVVNTSPTTDVASAGVDGLPRGVSQAESNPAVGVTVVVGSAHRTNRVREARVQTYLNGGGPADPKTVMRLDIGAEPGDSGGPVVDGRGRLVGLVYSAERGTGLTLVIPISEVATAIAGDQVPGRC